MAPLTATALVPEPGLGEQATLDPYVSVLPYSSRQLLTFPPLGFTLAFSVAAVCVIDEAEPVVTVGAFGNVFNVASLPWLVPPAFVAEIRK
jgi:hypothetical protein